MNLSKNSFAEVRSLIERALPVQRERQLILEQLCSSIDLANDAAPNAWCVTLFNDGFRMNVGNTEVLTFFTGSGIRLNLLLSDESLLIQVPAIALKTGQYKAIGGRSYRFAGVVEEFTTVKNILSKPHEAFIRKAGTKMNGSAWTGSMFMRFNCPTLVEYAKKYVAGNGEIHKSKKVSTEIEVKELGIEFFEGQKYKGEIDVFERSSTARNACIKHYGLACAVCGFEFEKRYGAVTEGYVHIHHLTSLAETGERHLVDPIKDLRPVCANCHSVIHLRQPPYAIAEVKAMLNANTLVAAS